jgi:two-component system response regulator TctD
MRLLIVEDNLELAGMMVTAMARSGYIAEVATSIAGATDRLASMHYAAVVLDLGLPDGDGLAVLRAVRGREDAIPVLILTARGGLEDRLAGFRHGADDYLVKPFDHQELIARLEALLRRPGQILGKVLRVGNLALDTTARQVVVDDAPKMLSAQDLRLLELLMRRVGRVVSKKYVEDQLFGSSPELGSNAVEVAIHRLRRRLEQTGADAEIHTARGLGYFIAGPPA